MNRIIFKDRADAGKQLAEKLSPYALGYPLILALPRGGVPVGFEIAQKLHAPLDIIVARKIGAPSNPEYGVGAIAPGDVCIFDTYALKSLGISEQDLEETIQRELKEMERRILLYKSGQWGAHVPADTIIVVDDGLATGVTALAALKSVRINFKPKKLIFAAPVCARDSIEKLRPYADAIIWVSAPRELMAIGAWYEKFDQVTDQEVLQYMARSRG